MQGEFRPAFGRGAQLAVEVALLPGFEDFRLALRQAGAHREIRLRQEQSLGIIALGLRHFGVRFGGLFSRRIRQGKGYLSPYHRAITALMVRSVA